MAQPTTASWTKLLILLGDGEVSEGFAAPCAPTKGIAITAETSDNTIQDCADPDAPTWVARVARALSAEVSGSGRLALESWETWKDWMLSGEGKNIRVKIDVPLANNGGHFAMSAVLTGLTVSGNEDDGKIGVDVTMVSDGQVTWVDASA
jgi:hypothetical protein